jgi:hypothetical protein
MLGCRGRSDARKINDRLGDIVKVVGEDVHACVSDDLDYLGVAKTSAARGSELRVGRYS